MSVFISISFLNPRFTFFVPIKSYDNETIELQTTEVFAYYDSLIIECKYLYNYMPLMATFIGSVT